MSAFQTYEQYMQQFGGALQNAANPPQPGLAGPNPSMGGAFNPADMPPPQQGAPAPAIPSSSPPAPQPQAAPAAGAFGAAPDGAAPSMAPPSGPVTPGPQQPGAFGAPASNKPPSGPMSHEDSPEGLTMKKLYDDSSDEEREELAKTMEQQVPGGDLVKAAKAAEEIEPTLAEKWGVGEWDRKEAAAFLMEFGLRMMAASGSGEGNFFSDVGESALGATEARRAFRKEKTAEEIAAEDREWKQKTRGREEGQWGAEDRETRRERMRKAKADARAGRAEERAAEKHDKEMSKGDWVKAIDENGNVVFEDPNTKQRWESGTTVDETTRSGGRGPTAFEIEWDFYKNAHVPEGWDNLSPTEQADVRKQFMRYKKTSSNLGSVVLRQEMKLAERMIEDHRSEWRGKPFPEVLAAARRQMQQEYPELYEGMGGEGGGVTPDWATDDGWHPPMAE